MAFNLSRYNLSAYNIDTGNERWIKALGEEEVTVSIGSALEIFADAIGYERVDTTLDGAPTHFFTGSGAEAVGELVAEGQISILIAPLFEEAVTAETDIQAEYRLTVPFAEQVTADTDIQANIYPVCENEEIVTAETALGANIYLDADGYELVSESASLVAIDTKTCYLNITLKPGETLIVDANTYNVLLNGENSVDVHSGDWIDELNRETTDITITAARGVANLSASILYTERYL